MFYCLPRRNIAAMLLTKNDKRGKKTGVVGC